MIKPAEFYNLLPDSLRKSFKINQPIFRAFHHSNRAVDFYYLLTESRDGVDAQGDSANSQIKALALSRNNGKWQLIWEIDDSIRQEEESVWFWTKYSTFEDHDGNEPIDPIIIYGTSAENGLNDGRLNVFIPFAGKKIFIRHQNAILDANRALKVDQDFHSLPSSLKTAVLGKLRAIERDGLALFPEKWETTIQRTPEKF